MAYDNLVNGSCFRFEKNVSDTVISHVGRHITCDVKGNCCLAFSRAAKGKLNLKYYIMNEVKKLMIDTYIKETIGYDLFNKVPESDKDKIIEFCKIVWNYKKMDNVLN